VIPASPIPLARYAAVPGAQMLHIQPAARYASAPPSLVGFRYDHADTARAFLRVLSRAEVEVPAEAVMLYPDAVVLDGRFVLSREGVGVEESFAGTTAYEVMSVRHPDRVARLAAGEATRLPAGGPPVVAIFKEHCQTFGHVVGEALPRLVHLAEMGLREIRLLVPDIAAPLRPVIDYALAALGIRAVVIPCPDGSAFRVAALHWVSPVSRYNQRLSPTLLRLMDKLRAAAAPADGPRRIFVTRPADIRRRLVNAAELEGIATAAGFTVVEPSLMDIGHQVALFAGAEWVAGPWGSGLTLSAAMAPGGRVTMIGSEVCDFFFWDIACLAGLRFDWAFAAPIAPFSVELQDRPLAIDPTLLARLLDGRSW